jgi:predicted transcriptional regulator
LHRGKEKKMAFILHSEFGYTKQAIANLMQISPQQMGQWIKEASYEAKLHQADKEIEYLRVKLIKNGYQPQKSLDRNDFIDLDF